ncbi:Fic/DOC family protein [Streptosporangium canum]|uniref:Fic/DOC family protein n=1 Tax=Streptosporangium canum TaxID=324952 RepID=A0A1I3KIM6_9ACTN|nr:Fic family protein [Streptosporangium canum]SFI72332.1 Fic/DOC family protein [Streptosporangium canum]
MSDPLAVIAELPGVPEAVTDARKAVDRLYGHRVLRRKSPEVSARSALRGARASAALDGVDVPLEAIPEVTDPVVQGALRVSAELGRLGPTWRAAPRQVLARLHTLAAAGLTERLGRPRGAAEAPDLLGLGAAPEPEETVARVDGLVGLVTGTSKAPALVLAAIVHAELAVLRPFGSADGVVARAAERLTLVEFGLDPKSLAAVELGHLELGAAYPESLKAYLSGTPDGVAVWVRHCASAVTLGVREATAICEAMQRG